MLKHGKFSILGICLLTFCLITGNLIPFMQAQAAPRSCAPLNTTTPPLADLNQRQSALAELQKIRSTALVTGTKSGLGPSLGNLPITGNTGFSGIRAQNHATYLANNPNDFGKAYEVNPGNGCFSNLGNEGAKIAARFATTNNTVDAIDQAMASVYMRLPLLEPHLATMGIGFDSIFTVLDDASSENYTNTISASFDNYVIGYPGPNVASPISTTFLAGEGITNTGLTVAARTQGGAQPDGSILGISGDPINGGTNPTTNAGFPISVVFDKNAYTATPIINSYSLVETSGAVTTPVILKPPSDIFGVFNPLLGTNTPAAAVLIPVNPLKPNTDYTVRFAFVGGAGAPAPNGKEFSWTFKTADVQITPTPGTGTPGTPGTPTPNNGAIPGYTPIILPTSAAGTPTPTAGLPGAPGIPAGGGPTSFYTPTPGNGANPNQFFQVWRRVDDPVKNSLVNRSWLYGPLPYGFSILYENYEGGRRIVAYHDKARMELNNPASGYVSNGLLVREMISGGLQLGDNIFDVRTAAANQSVAGDPYELNPGVPSYAVFAGVASLNNDKRVGPRINQQVVETMDRNGSISTNFGTAGYGVTYVYYDYNLGHNIANKFWSFMNQGGLVRSEGGYYNDQVFDWVSVMGLPLSEPYWVKAYVGGQQKDVLVQVFERRVLTFTPSNSPNFQVEMGNVGRAYYKWRYGREP